MRWWRQWRREGNERSVGASILRESESSAEGPGAFLLADPPSDLSLEGDDVGVGRGDRGLFCVAPWHTQIHLRVASRDVHIEYGYSSSAFQPHGHSELTAKQGRRGWAFGTPRLIVEVGTESLFHIA